MNGGKKSLGKVLIVDDVPKNIQVLGTILRDHGYQVYVAQDGMQALNKVEKILPDLILLDIMMPKLDGFETCRRLKLSENAEIPIMFLTAKTATADILKGFELGAVDYVTKPFNSTELLMRVSTHLELKRNRELLAKQNFERKELLHVLSHDLTNCLMGATFVMESAETNKPLFLEMKDHVVASLKNGMELIVLVRDLRSLLDRDFDLPLETLNLERCFQESLFMLKKSAEEKNIKFKIDIPDVLHVEAERSSFVNLVLQNLLSNAVKFSYPDSNIYVNALQERETIILSIRDSGMGMPKEIIADLFEMGKTTLRPGTNEERGTGHGMPLVEGFVHAYGGSIAVESSEDESDHGTLISLTLKSGL